MYKNEKQIPHDLQQNDLQLNDLNQPNANPSANNDWQTYRTRFTVRARILTAPLSFVDALGREQNGKRGDYLVESNGVVTINSRRIFEDVYVPLTAPHNPGLAVSRQPTADSSLRKSPISTKKNGFFPAARRRSL